MQEKLDDDDLAIATVAKFDPKPAVSLYSSPAPAMQDRKSPPC